MYITKNLIEKIGTRIGFLTKILLLTTVCFTAVLPLTSCKETKKIILLEVDQPGIDDRSWYQHIWNGFTANKDRAKVEVWVNDVEGSGAGFKEKFEKADMIVVVDTNMHEQAIELAEKNPGKTVILFDVGEDFTPSEPLPGNVSTVAFDVKESAFAAGYIAQKTAEKTNSKVGFIGGQDMKPIRDLYNGFRQGVKYANPNADVQYEISNEWSNEKKLETIAARMYKDCGVIFAASGKANIGVFNIAENEGKWVIGIDFDQTYLAPENVLTCVIKNANIIASNLIKSFLNGDELKNVKLVLGVEDDGYGAGTSIIKNGNVSDELWAETEKFHEKIKNGEIIIS